MKIALYDHWKEATHIVADLTFAEFCSGLGTDTKPDTGKKTDTYAWAPAEYQPGKTRAKQFGAPFEKVALIHALALDFDGADKLGVPEADVLELMRALEGQSFVTYSSYNHHAVIVNQKYKFRVVLELSRPITCAEHEQLLAYVTTLLPTPPDPSCKDPTRIFGLPMMYHPTDFVERSEGEPLDVDAMLALAPAVTATKQTPQIVLEAAIDRKAATKFATKLSNKSDSNQASIGRLLKRVLDGSPYATAETERHGTARTLTMTLEREFQNATPVAITQLFRGSVAAMSAEDPSFDIDARMSDIERLVEGARRLRLESEAETAAATQAIETARIAASRPDGKDTLYDENDKKTIAQMQGCSIAELEHRWVIVKGNTFYFLTLEGYKGPYSSTGFPAAIRDHLAPTDLPFEHYLEAADEWRMRSIGELVKDYGSECMKIVASMSAQTGTYDGVTLIESVCKLRKLSHEWDPEFATIDRYVGLFAGKHAEKYRDWLATFPELDRPTAALYLSGPKGTGKTLLPEMLARLYTTGAATDLADAWGNFNEALLNCPVIKADEALPPGATSARVREIVGVVCRTLKRKHVATAEMHGAIRLILSANRDDMLSFNETQSTDELDATAQRIFHIETSATAQAFLERTPHRHWVTKDVFARYVLWLQKTRGPKVERGPRWLVEGHMPEMRAKLATSGPNERFCEWIVGYLSSPEKIAGTDVAGLVLVRGGDLWLNSQACAKQWSAYTTEAARNDTPTPGRASLALKALSTSHETIRTKAGSKSAALKFWRINTDHVFDWAERNGVGDVEQMRAAVVATRETVKLLT